MWVKPRRKNSGNIVGSWETPEVEEGGKTDETKHSLIDDAPTWTEEGGIRFHTREGLLCYITEIHIGLFSSNVKP